MRWNRGFSTAIASWRPCQRAQWPLAELPDTHRNISYKASRPGSVTRLDSTNCNIHDPYALPRDIHLTLVQVHLARIRDGCLSKRLNSQFSRSRADAGQGSSLAVRLISKQRHPPSFRVHHNSFSTPLLGAVGAAAVALRVPLF